MPTSRLGMFSKLYSKEMRELAPEMITVIGLAVLAYIYLFFKTHDYPFAVIGPVFMIGGMAAFLPVISSFKLLSREWKNNTVYLMMSLPVKGGMIMGAKLTALLSEYVLGTLIAGVSGFLLIYALNPELGQVLTSSIPGIGMKLIELWPQGLALYLTSIVIIAYIASISFFSQMVGKLVSRFSGLVTAVVFIATAYLSGKVGDLFWLNIDKQWFTNGINTFDLNVINQFLIINLLFSLALAAVIFTLAVIIYNRKIEL
ncbi:MAG: hypothetical protein PHT79_04305 [Syntrophomonadaceae bacterium]|nr:hypothetical protein [Syntrophomonadaceae bacterium]MDD3889897.1 hypothetical protein [Syntrophomonadaceae bacterium]MDD4548965.1 hypothetical protein [Syntrophomonadaceae bacterium]